VKVDVASPPEKGKANDELIRFLADHVGIAKSRVRVVMGEFSRQKVVEFDGISTEYLLQSINEPRRNPGSS
jgi:hypothetical protein